MLVWERGGIGMHMCYVHKVFHSHVLCTTSGFHGLPAARQDVLKTGLHYLGGEYY